MFYGQTTSDTRTFFIEAWRKFQAKLPLAALEQQIVNVIHLHPEYHGALTEHSIDKTYFPELGETNPFLHLGFHLALRDQITLNRPLGITAVFNRLCNIKGEHEAEHQLMDILAKILWEAQRNQSPPDEAAYLRQCEALLLQ